MGSDVLMECRSCKEWINDEASICPYCGEKHPQPYSGVEIALMIGAGIGGLFGFILGLPFFIIGGIIGGFIGAIIGATL